MGAGRGEGNKPETRRGREVRGERWRGEQGVRRREGALEKDGGQGSAEKVRRECGGAGERRVGSLRGEGQGSRGPAETRRGKRGNKGSGNPS